jgi:hypothetical protein
LRGLLNYDGCTSHIFYRTYTMITNSVVWFAWEAAAEPFIRIRFEEIKRLSDGYYCDTQRSSLSLSLIIKKESLDNPFSSKRDKPAALLLLLNSQININRVLGSFSRAASLG